MPTRPVGGRGGRPSRLRALLILDKLSRRTPAPRDMATGFGRHLHVYPEPAVVEHGLVRRCGWCMPTRPVGGGSGILAENRNFVNFVTFTKRVWLTLGLRQFKASILVTKGLRRRIFGS